MVSLGLAPFKSSGFLRGREPFACKLYSGSIGNSNTLFRDWPSNLASITDLSFADRRVGLKPNRLLLIISSHLICTSG